MDSAEFYKKSLKEIYDDWPQCTRDAVDHDAKKIWRHFISWCVFTLVSIACILFLVEIDIINEPVEKRFQRAGALISFTVFLGEAFFLYKLNRLAQVLYPVTLQFEVYKARRFKPLLIISFWVSALFVCVGAIVSGYGDILYECFAL